MKYIDFIAKAKFNQEYVIEGLRRAKFFDRAEKIDTCGLYKYFALCDDCSTLHFNGANTCKDKFCAVCNKKRSLLWLSRIKPIVDHLLMSGKKIIFVTFTVKNTEKLQDGIDMLRNAFRYMINRWRQSAKEFKRLFDGGIRSMEIKRGAGDKLWHPHYHCLFVKHSNTPLKDDFDFLKSVWERSCCAVSDCTEENAKLGSVDIKTIKPRKSDDYVGAILETFKYITKFDWQNSDDIVELVQVLHGVRLIIPFGCIRELLSVEDIEKDMDKSLRELAVCRCSICGGDHFTEFTSSDCGFNHTTIVHDFSQEILNYANCNVEDIDPNSPMGRVMKKYGLKPISVGGKFLDELFKPKPESIQLKIEE